MAGTIEWTDGYNIKWDDPGKHYYETGIDHCVLYVYDTTTEKYAPAVEWNGISNITESPSGAEESPVYADNIKYLALRSIEELGLSIEAYTYPKEWEECDGSKALATGVYAGQQERKKFGLCYRTKEGDDNNNEYYKLHLIYGCTASPSERAYATINDSPEAISMSWEISTVPVAVTGGKNTSRLTIDSRTADPDDIQSLLDILYGKPAVDSTPAVPGELILPDAVAAVFQ